MIQVRLQTQWGWPQEGLPPDGVDCLVNLTRHGFKFTASMSRQTWTMLRLGDGIFEAVVDGRNCILQRVSVESTGRENEFHVVLRIF